MAIKPQYITYQSKNNTTGLTDVKAQVYLNGVAKLVGASAVVLTEVDATNSPGLYQLLLTALQLTTMGVVTGQVNSLVAYIDSVTKPGKAPLRIEVELYDLDDLVTLVGTPANVTVSADIAAVKTDTAAIKVDLESGASSLPTILAAINSIKNNAGFSVPVPTPMLVPNTGSNTYLIPVTIYNEANTLIDPDSNTITVSVANQAGTSRNTYLSATTMTRLSTGQYTVVVTIAAAAPEEQLLFSFAYAIGGNATVRKASTNVIPDVTADGLALQSTLLATQTTVNANNALLSNATYGLSALQVIEAANQGTLNNATYGLPALQTQGAANASALAAIEGTGFVTGTDSLHQLSQAIANIGVGGRAV